MSKRGIERVNHDERQRGKHIHLSKGQREEVHDRCACGNCDRVILAAQIRRCGLCGECFCSHCMKGSACESCERDDPRWDDGWNEEFDRDMDAVEGRISPIVTTDVDVDGVFDSWEEDDCGALWDY